MYTNILIPIALDHEYDVQRTIETARRLMAKPGKITLVAVLENVPAYVAEYATVKPADHVRAEIEQRLRALATGQNHIDAAVLSGKPGVTIPDLAAETSADLIVINSHRPGVEDYFLGSTASRVVRRAPCSVLVLR
ncbi:universal stress protein [Ruegeria sp. 2205SS24-7]|uniref:universal stress protein n=1 Tax=Ruegeria discodermiae TaxID=3064389 RepID=UPI00274241D1|nr:universal stress protein [Ruegeria sp. 2205SS24-7]MDP5220223.1 universal stress protein [Ruegeria sp. 2205SS24-7]